MEYEIVKITKETPLGIHKKGEPLCEKCGFRINVGEKALQVSLITETNYYEYICRTCIGNWMSDVHGDD